MLSHIEFKCKRVLRILHMKMTSFHEVIKCVFKWCEAHDIHKYALFFLFSTYIITAYQPLWQGWYDTYVLSYLAYLDSRDMDSFPNAAYFMRY